MTENIPCIFLTKDVLKFEISNELSNRQKSNILSIFVTNDVLKFDKLRKSKNNNMLKIKWKNNLKSCRFMFLSMSNIVEIDLSNFDTSSVTDMSYMFYYCFSLSSLNVSNFDTSLVTDMSYMFFFAVL